MGNWAFLVACALCALGCGSDSDSGGGSGGSSSGGSSSGGSSSGGSAGSGGSSTGGTSSGGSAGSGGSATGGSSTGGASSGGGTGGTSSGGSSGTMPKSAVDECKYSGTTAAPCAGTAKPHHWECDTNPNDTPPAAGCEHPVNFPKAWCCPSEFCSRYTGADALCGPTYPTKPTGYICAASTPGTSGCSQPNPIAMPQVYCCP